MKDNYFEKYKIENVRKSHGGEIFKLGLDKDPDFLDFSININPLAGKHLYFDALKTSISQIEKYPDSQSSQLKKELIHQFHKEITPENIIIGAGAMDLITLFCDSFILKGDKVIVSQPTFSEYEWAILKNHGILMNVQRNPENYFKISPSDIINKLHRGVKAIFICNPNNPNGLLDKIEDIEEIILKASKFNILVFLDEAFIEFIKDSDYFIKKINNFDNLFVCRSLTKFYGVPGLRIGYGIGTPKLINILNHNHNLWSVNCIAQIVTEELIRNKEFQARSREIMKQEYLFLKTELKKIKGLVIFPSDTNFLLVNTSSLGITSGEIKTRLLKWKVLIRNCENYEGLNEYYFRICIKNREENIRFLTVLKNVLEL